ncbi:MAG: ADP-ribosylglycohydrolase family protein [Planctomycetota bacterium]|jgi:ADP-ribosylglycohydrolase
MADQKTLADRMAGLLLGMAVGDAIGLPREGLTRRRAQRLYGDKPLKHRFAAGRGMISDDTEHACMVAQAWLASKGDARAFARSLAWRLRFWLLGVPAGVGFATLRGICKLWLGFSPERSGVNSAGNGPAMRSPVLGICAGDEPENLADLVRASTRLTHTDERAIEGAMAVALACHYASRRQPEQIEPDELFALLRKYVVNEEFARAMQLTESAIRENLTALELAQRMGLEKGISGYIVHTVPMAIFSWLRNRTSFRDAVEEVVLLGGDTDTTGAITGAIAGASLGYSAIPQEWLSDIIEWPRSVTWMKRLSEHMTHSISKGSGYEASGPLKLFWPAIMVRNIFFTSVVILHGLRRLMPPY